MIELRPSDLSIGEYKDKETDEIRSIVRIDWRLATDERFIKECHEAGVEVYNNLTKGETNGEKE